MIKQRHSKTITADMKQIYDYQIYSRTQDYICHRQIVNLKSIYLLQKSINAAWSTKVDYLKRYICQNKDRK